jgi:hypothetical protein
VSFYKPWSNMKVLMLFHDFDVIGLLFHDFDVIWSVIPWFWRHRSLNHVISVTNHIYLGSYSWTYLNQRIRRFVGLNKLIRKIHGINTCNRNQYWVLSSRSAKSWNNIKILMLFHDFHVRPWFVKVHYF